MRQFLDFTEQSNVPGGRVGGRPCQLFSQINETEWRALKDFDAHNY